MLFLITNQMITQSIQVFKHTLICKAFHWFLVNLTGSLCQSLHSLGKMFLCCIFTIRYTSALLLVVHYRALQNHLISKLYFGYLPYINSNPKALANIFPFTRSSMETLLSFSYQFVKKSKILFDSKV